jgi:hypothetical protein
MMDYEYQERKGNLLAEIYSLRNLYTVYYLVDVTKYFLFMNTNSVGTLPSNSKV